MKRREKLFDKFYKKTGLRLTDEPTKDPKVEGITEDVDEIYHAVLIDPNSRRMQLEALVKKYPRIPLMKNLLHGVYINTGRIKKANAMQDKLLKEHPKYIFGISTAIRNSFTEEEVLKLEKYLGPNKSITDFKKPEEIIHTAEYYHYQYALAKFYTLTEEDTAAADAVLPLLDLGFEDDLIDELIEEIAGIRLERVANIMRNYESDDVEKVNRKSVFQTNISETPPTFNHPETKLLYELDLDDFEAEHQKTIADLPRESLIEDLEAVLMDSIERYDELASRDYMDESREFPIHALYFLGAFESEKSLQSVLNLFRIHSDFLEYYFGDIVTEFTSPTLFAIGKNQLPVFSDFIKEEGNDFMAFSAAFRIASQVALHHPERRSEVIAWYSEAADFILENLDNPNINKRDFINFWIMHIDDIKAHELAEYIDVFETNNLIDARITGDAEMIKRELNGPLRDASLSPMPENLAEYYSGEYLDRRAEYEAEEDLSGEFVPTHPVEKRIHAAMEELAASVFEEMYEDFDEDEEDFEGEEMSDKEFYETMMALMEEEESMMNPPIETVRRSESKISRNAPCPCGSGKKYKRCCLKK